MSKTFLHFLVLGFIVSVTTSCAPEEEIRDVIIIGGGLMGSATGWQVSSDSEVLLLEKQDSIYDSGSSLGEARIARSSNRGDDMWSYMHNTSVDEVEKLIEFLNAKTGTTNFEMSDIYTTQPVSYLGKLTIHDKLLASLIRQEVDYKMAVTPAEGKEMFGVDLPDDVLLQKEYNNYSGTINPEQLINYLHQGIEINNGEVRYNSEVKSLLKVDGMYEIEIYDKTKDLTYKLKSKNVISAAGPYTGTLLRDVAPYFDGLINPQRVFLAFYKIRKEVYENLPKSDIQKLIDAYPVINSSKGTRDGSFFSMIEYYEDGIPVIKIGGHFQRSVIKDMDQVWKLDLNQNERDWAFNSTLGYFQLLGLPISEDDMIFDHGYSCVYSLTDNEVPLVTPVLGEGSELDKSLIVLGGMSGVGAKGAMTYGLLASDILKNQESRADTMYSHARSVMGSSRLVDYLQ